MKRFTVLLGVLMLGVVIGSARGSLGRDEPCAGFTTARLLEDPELARQYFGALHAGDLSARQQLEAMVGELRAVHGCGELEGAERAMRDRAPEPSTPRLPPGHPPLDAPPAPVFETDGGETLTI